MTLQVVLQRCRDVKVHCQTAQSQMLTLKEDVRRQAFMVLCTSIDLRALSISDRVSLLKTGFGDRCGESHHPSPHSPYRLPFLHDLRERYVDSIFLTTAFYAFFLLFQTRSELLVLPW
jgi:hypothetical protein